MKKLVKFVMIGLVVIVIVVVILFLPFIFKDRTQASFEGPDLSELQYTEVFFKNGDLTLAGMLFLPKGEGPFPVVVFIHGSGTSRRNSPWYLAVAQYFQKNGIAVLLPDKRGSEKSEGDWTKSTFHDFAGDASSAIDFIQSQAMFEYSIIGVMGHSQGGWVVPVVATKNQDVAFVVSSSGPGVTVDEQIEYGEVHEITELGTYRFVAELLAPLTAKVVMKGECCRMIVGFDPIPYWQQVKVPSFMAFGEGDQNVPVEESMSRIRGLNNPHITIKVYPEGGHGILESLTPGSYRIQEEFLRDVVDFIGATNISQ